MRKTLAIILSTVMILSLLCVIGVSAETPEGTAINNASEFAGMAADGTYYLNADITITASYEDYFTGTLDGNGHTVTISAPMFKTFDGTIKNITVNGSLAAQDESLAAVAVRTVNGMIAENVTTNVDIDITGTVNGLYAGGIVATDNIVDGADNNANAHSEFWHCTNNGNIIITVVTDDPSNSKPRAGGLAAIIEDAICVDCHNTGNIVNRGASSEICGGLIGRVALKAAFNQGVFLGCTNTGNIEASGHAGGIAGYIGCSGNMGFSVFYGCYNSGDMKGVGQAGGIVAYVYGSGSSEFADIQYCVNTGDLYYGKPLNPDTGAVQSAYASNFVDYTNTTMTTISYNIGTGKYILNDGATLYAAAFIACSSADSSAYSVSDNYIYDADNFIKYYSYPNDPVKNEANIREISFATENGMISFVTLDQIKSEVINQINSASGGEILYEDLATVIEGAATNYSFTFDSKSVDSAGIPMPVMKAVEGTDPGTDPGSTDTTPAPGGDDTTPAPGGDDTTPAPGGESTTVPGGESTTVPGGNTDNTTAPGGNDTTKADDKKDSSCKSTFACGIALVAVFGSAVVLGKKH